MPFLLFPTAESFGADRQIGSGVLWRGCWEWFLEGRVGSGMVRGLRLVCVSLCLCGCAFVRVCGSVRLRGSVFFWEGALTSYVD